MVYGEKLCAFRKCEKHGYVSQVEAVGLSECRSDLSGCVLVRKMWAVYSDESWVCG